MKSLREVAVFFEPEHIVQVDPVEMRAQCELYNISSLDIIHIFIDPKEVLCYRQFIYKSTFSSRGIQDRDGHYNKIAMTNSFLFFLACSQMCIILFYLFSL